MIPATQVPLIALVEPDPALMRVVNRALTLEGFRTLLVKDAAESAALILDQQPDLAMLDTEDDDSEAAWNLYAEIRRYDRTARLPLVICSNQRRRTKATKEVVRQDGLVSVLSKPFEPDVLVDRIKYMLGAQRLLSAAAREVSEVEDARSFEQARAKYVDSLKFWTALDGQLKRIASAHVPAREEAIITTSKDLNDWVHLIEARDQAFKEYRAAEHEFMSLVRQDTVPPPRRTRPPRVADSRRPRRR